MLIITLRLPKPEVHKSTGPIYGLIVVVSLPMWHGAPEYKVVQQSRLLK